MSYSGIKQQKADNRPYAGGLDSEDDFNNKMFLLRSCNNHFPWRYKGVMVVVITEEEDKVFIRSLDMDKKHMDGWVKTKDLLKPTHL